MRYKEDILVKLKKYSDAEIIKQKADKMEEIELKAKQKEVNYFFQCKMFNI